MAILLLNGYTILLTWIKPKNTMKFIYKDTGQIFENRKEAKLYFGNKRYNSLLRNNRFEFINLVAFNYVQCKDNRPNKQ